MNVVIVVIDALRADRVGALGGRSITPNIDEFADEATQFSNAFSVSNATDVAVTSIQTGKYPLSHGVVNHGRQVTNVEKKTIEQVTQLPEVLSREGYRTAKFGRPLGRWHRKGFDRYPSSMESVNAFDENGGKTITRHDIGNVLESIHPKLKSTAETAYQRIKLLYGKASENSARSQNSRDNVIEDFKGFIGCSEPFYSFVHLMDTHTPYVADPEVVVSYLEKFNYTPHVPMSGTGSHPGEFDQLVKREYPEIEKKYYLPDGTPTTAVTDAHYDAAATQADKRFGAAMSALKEEGVYDDTLVVFLSDHGESLTEHGIYHDHHGLYDTSVHIPLIIRPPGGNGQNLNDLVQITDIAPTVEDYAGVEGLSSDGYSLRHTIENSEEIDRKYVMAEEAHTQRRRMIRSNSSKLIHLVDGDTICRYCGVQHAPEVEWYDLEIDQHEIENTVDMNRSSVSEFREYGDQKADEFCSRRPDIKSESENVEYKDEKEVEERLEALGYR